MTTCKSCGAEIRFIATKKGKFLPVDVEEHLFSRIEEGSETYVTIDGQVHTKGKRIENWEGGKPLYGYTPHWATCPYADLYRRKGGRKQ